MLWKTIKHSLQIVSAVFAGLALVVLVLAWKLSQGPISIPQLTPFIVEGVSKNTRGLSVRIKDTILSWEGWERNLDIRVLGVNIFTRDGRRVASIPEIALSLSGQALITGVVAPNSLELFEPKIDLLRRSDGTFAFAFGSGMTLNADRAFQLDQFFSKIPDPKRPLSYLEEVRINSAELEYVDKATGLAFKAPNTSFELERIGETLILDTGLDMFLSGKPVKIDVSASYNLTTELLDGDVAVHNLHIGDLANLSKELNVLKPLQFSVAGKAKITMNGKGEIRSFFVDMKSRDGSLEVPEPAAQSLALDVISIRGNYEDLDGKFRLEEGLIALAKGSLIQIPMPIDHNMPMESLRLIGDYDIKNDKIYIENLDFDLGEGPTGNIKGNIEGLLKGDSRKVDIVGEILNTKPSNLKRYWPKSLSVDAQNWVTNRLSDGIVPRASINVSLSQDKDGTVTIHHLNGDMEMEGLSVDYLPPMPKVRNAQGWAKYSDKSFHITITGGNVDKINVKSGQIDITGFDEFYQTMNVAVSVDGPLRDTLQFIDKEPLGFAKALGLDAGKTSGEAETDLQLSFLLKDALTFEEVEVSAKAVGKNVTIKDVVFDQDLNKGKIKLNVDKKGMDVVGKVTIGTIPTDLSWRENFTKDTLFRSRFLLNGTVTNEQRMGELRLNFPPFTQDIMRGPVQVDAIVSQNWDGQGSLETFVNLKQTEIDIPVIEWRKEIKKEGQAYARITFNKDRLLGVPYFSITSDGLEGAGSLNLDKTGEQIQTLNISRFKAGRTDISGGTILHSPKVGWEADLHGNSLDLTKILTDARKSDRSQQADNKDTDLSGTFSGRFNQIWLDEKSSLDNVAGAISSDGKIWTQAHLTGVVGGGAPFVIDLSPEGVNRRLKLETKDAGAMLRALDLFDDMKGGDLVIDGVLNDEAPRRPLVGKITVENYRIVKVPALAKVLSLVGLTGVFDSLEGDGIGFTSLVSPFKHDNGVIEFKDGRTNGISIGLTWEGKIYTHANVADMKGTVVPAYGLNSLLGNVPILGKLFSAEEKGGGLFAWTFDVTGNLDDAKVSVNPISALAPGFLRGLFQGNPSKEEAPQ